MIITRTPFRISFAGGGSDLPCFFAQEPGAVLTAGFNKYMYLAVKERFGNTFRVSYSRTELTDTIDAIEHPIVREALKCMEITQGLEIVSVADLPGSSGMGSSSSFTVGLLHALHVLKGRSVTSDRLAEQACHIEIDTLKEPIGKQDQYIAAHGGLKFIQFQPDGKVFIDPVICKRGTWEELDRRLLLFFTGMTRSAGTVLAKQQANCERRRPALRQLCQTARDLRDVLTDGNDLNEFGRLLHTAWETKKSLETSITNKEIDGHYQRGLEAGALGGKLLGAGSGGFLLFFCEPHLQSRLRDAMGNLIEVPFRMEPEGSKVIFVGSNRW
ncbi:MAG: GHMP kinase [Planctomycetia bacterium]|nr:GHMP kinase [Planctomycetia bacterium]